MSVMAMSTATNNAELIGQAAALGYVDGRVLDPTFGLGRFWTNTPVDLTACDLDPRRARDLVADFTALPFADRSFRTVVLDPPYKLNGTSSGKGAAACDGDYGVGAGSDWSRLSWQDRHTLIRAGITEAVRCSDRWVLVKCQDQVNGGKVRWQTREFADHAESLGCRLVDMLHLGSYRKQPAGRRQVHARRNYSTLLVVDASNAPTMTSGLIDDDLDDDLDDVAGEIEIVERPYWDDERMMG